MQDSTRVLAVVNPRAGQGRIARQWQELEARLRAVFPHLESVFTEQRAHATEITRRALEQGTQLIVSVGGDGTNNEVLAGFTDAQGKNRFPTAELALLPAGRGSDFVRAFGAVSFDEWLFRMTQPARAVDYGVVRSEAQATPTRVFLNLASLGASTRVLQYANAATGKLGAELTYLVSSLRGIANHQNDAVWITYDDEPPRLIQLTLLCVANGQYFGAGMWVNPLGDVADGLLDVIEVVDMSRFALTRALASVYRGKHLGRAGITHHRCRRVTLRPEDAEAALAIETDGEVVSALPATFEVQAAGLRVRALG